MKWLSIAQLVVSSLLLVMVSFLVVVSLYTLVRERQDVSQHWLNEGPVKICMTSPINVGCFDAHLTFQEGD